MVQLIRTSRLPRENSLAAWPVELQVLYFQVVGTSATWSRGQPGHEVQPDHEVCNLVTRSNEPGAASSESNHRSMSSTHSVASYTPAPARVLPAAAPRPLGFDYEMGRLRCVVGIEPQEHIRHAQRRVAHARSVHSPARRCIRERESS